MTTCVYLLASSSKIKENIITIGKDSFETKELLQFMQFLTKKGFDVQNMQLINKVMIFLDLLVLKFLQKILMILGFSFGIILSKKAIENGDYSLSINNVLIILYLGMGVFAKYKKFNDSLDFNIKNNQLIPKDQNQEQNKQQSQTLTENQYSKKD